MWHWLIIGVLAWFVLSVAAAPLIGTYLHKLKI